MPKSSRLKLSQVRAAFQLVSECCELGADPIAWRLHLLRGINRLVDGDVAFGGRADWGDVVKGVSSRDKILQVFSDIGWATDSDRRVYLDWITHGTPLDNPMTRVLMERGVFKSVSTRPDLVDVSNWRRAPLVDSFRHTARLDEAMCSVELLEPGKLLLLAVQRSIGRRAFQERERRLLELIHDEVRRHLGTRLALFDARSVYDLPPRLRDVLHCLLEGDGEKQVAARLGLSPHTIHTHIKRLHRRFGAATRGELLVRCYGYLSVLRQLAVEADARRSRRTSFAQ